MTLTRKPKIKPVPMLAWGLTLPGRRGIPFFPQFGDGKAFTIPVFASKAEYRLWKKDRRDEASQAAKLTRVLITPVPTKRKAK